MFGLDPDTLRKIRDCFAQFPQIHKVLLYGSRAMGTQRPGSDIDITLIGKNLTRKNTLHPLNEALDELLLPFTFDLSIFTHLEKPELIQHILERGVCLYQTEVVVKEGWEIKKLGKVCSLVKRGIAPKYMEVGGVRVVNQKCIRDHSINFERARRNDSSKKNVPEERLIQIGDVLVNSTGTGTLGRVAQVRTTPSEVTTVDTHVTIVRPIAGKFINDFFGYMLIVIENELKEAGEGCGGQIELGRKVLEESFEVSYPLDLAQQEEIVEVLDKAFAAIDQAKANIEQNIANAKELFQSKLNQIFSQKGEGWVEKSLSQTLESQPRNGWSPPAANHSDSGTPVLTLSSVTGFEFRKEKIKHTSIETDSGRHYWVNNGELLITRSNTPKLVGHVAIAEGIEQRTIYPDLIMRMIPDASMADTRFLYYQLRSPFLRETIIGRASGANPTMKKINKSAVQTLPISLPPISQQKLIVRELDALSESTKELESHYQTKLTSLDELKKSILQKAFAGELT